MEYTVIGGGLAGLSAAVALARAGASVDLIEKRRELGGRAQSTTQDGCVFNFGPHALYRKGLTWQTLKAWGISLSGCPPELAGHGCFVSDGERYPFVAGVAALATSRLLTASEKFQFAVAFARLTSRRPGRDVSVAVWLDRNASRPRVRRLLSALIRLTTYSNSPDRLSFEATRQRFVMSSGGVVYVDGGWQKMIDGLVFAARGAGVRIHTGSTAGPIQRGTILAVSPDEASRLTGAELPPCTPEVMATLDLAIDGLPEGSARFALGLDQPLYFSVHSEWARLAPKGVAIIHAAKYLTAGETATRSELELWCDTVMPNWRGRVLHARFLPQMVVAHSGAELTGRPAANAFGLSGVRIAGDWVGSEGMLADTAVASGLEAASQLMAEMKEQ